MDIAVITLIGGLVLGAIVSFTMISAISVTHSHCRNN